MNGERRKVCVLAGAGAVAAIGVPIGAAVARGDDLHGTQADVHFELRAVRDQVALRPGRETDVWRFRAQLLRGEPGSVKDSAGGYLGPVIRVRRGDRVRVDFHNELPEPTIVHWHGLHVPDDMDGHPRFAIGTGERYVYEFTIRNRAGTYWFHPHPHGRTGAQVYRGLAGLLIVTDEAEAALGLPSGDDDVPLVIQDRSFDPDNQLIYLGERTGEGSARDNRGGMMGGGMMGGGMMGGGMRGMMAGMMGMFGDRILVNAREDASFEFPRRPHRLRLLNGSNSRIYRLAWGDGTPLTVIGTDGGLLAAPIRRSQVMLSPGERVDLWVDFGDWPAGAEIALRSLAFDAGSGGMMGGMMGSSTLPDGAEFIVLRARVARGPREAGRPLPARLSVVPAVDVRGAINADRPKVFELTMAMMQWGINGSGFDMHGASPLETVRLGTREVWEFRNDARSGMMGMAMPHAMHVHGLQFRVIGRSKGGRRDVASSLGTMDEGWKDTVLVMPGERVRIVVRFEDYAGLFLYHCHMLEHEDSGLMRNFRVVG